MSYWFNSERFGKSQIEQAIYGAARPHLSFDQIKSFTLPKIEPRDANEAVGQIECAFASIDRLAAEARSARDALERLDQAIRAKAFRGELVPQDPNDEPASVLLERIRAERAAAGPALKRGRRPRGASA